jgi:uncharacterized protein with PQ loop repeat
MYKFDGSNLKSSMKGFIHRREFLRNTALTGAGLMFLPQAIKAFSTEKKDKVKVGMVAVRLRGQLHLEEMLKFSVVGIIVNGKTINQYLDYQQHIKRSFSFW